jgi:hypothetical protein
MLNESISVRLLAVACRVAKQFCFYWLPITPDLRGGQINGIECVVLKERDLSVEISRIYITCCTEHRTVYKTTTKTFYVMNT